MTHPDSLHHHGDEVLVFDAKGNYECRGVIVGVHRCNPPIYDVQIRNTQSLTFRRCGIPEAQIRLLGKAISAYENRATDRKGTVARHIMDEA